MAYAEKTDVSVGKTKGEIDNLLRKHKARGFGVFEEEERATLVFEMAERRIVFRLPIPRRGAPEFNLYKQGSTTFRRTDSAAQARWEQACRSRWRALFLCVKAKLESVESGIETFEEAFLAHIQMPDGMSVGEHVRPRIEHAYKTNSMQPLLPGPKQ